MITTTLRKLSEYTARGISPKYVETNGLMVLNQKCIRNQKIDFSPVRLTDANKKFAPSKKIKLHDILINSTGVGTLGRVAQVSKELNATVDSHITIFRSLDYSKELDIKICKKYIGYALREKEKEIEGLGKGATGQTELSKDSVLDNIEIRIPKEFEKQNEIASVLAVYDDLMENNEKRIKILEEMAQLIYTEWFVKFKFPGHEKVKLVDSGTEFGIIPEGWEVVQIESLLSKIKRKAKLKTSEYQTTGLYPVVDQGVSFIAGYTDNKDLVYEEDLIVFGDHSRCFKYCNFPFACGADGTQLLKTNDTERMPQILLYFSVVNAGLQNYNYARHFKFLKALKLLKPDQASASAFDSLVNQNYIQIEKLKQANIVACKIRDLLIPQLVTCKRQLK